MTNQWSLNIIIYAQSYFQGSNREKILDDEPTTNTTATAITTVQQATTIVIHGTMEGIFFREWGSYHIFNIQHPNLYTAINMRIILEEACCS